ncbi:hypothetical protein V8F20_011189 [Naviculisporaceae sp. PSN 640]
MAFHILNTNFSLVCGEVVCRGDECVSLGWCFWHRACYGCLLCGNKRVVKGVRLAELFTDRESSDDDGDRETGTDEERRLYPGTKKGREIDQVPLCANCMADVDANQLDERSVVQKGLRRMDQTDSGMSRRRWEGTRLGKEKAIGSKEAAPGQQRCGPQNRIQHDTQTGSIYGNGADSRSVTESDVPQQHVGCSTRVEPSTVYVSMFDPIGRPAFRPSPTKPIPQWMNMTPNIAGEWLDDDERLNRDSLQSAQRELYSGSDIPDSDRSTRSLVDLNGGQQLLARNSGHRAGRSRSSDASTIRPTRPKLQARLPTKTMTAAQPGSTDDPVTYHTGQVPYKGRPYLADEPSRLLSLDPEYNESISPCSTYATAHEYPSSPPSTGESTTGSFSERHKLRHYFPSGGLSIRKGSHVSTSGLAKGQDISVLPQPQNPSRMRRSITNLHACIPTPSRGRSASDTATSPGSHRGPLRESASAPLRMTPGAETTSAIAGDQVKSTVSSNKGSKDQFLASPNERQEEGLAQEVNVDTPEGSSIGLSKRRSVYSGPLCFFTSVRKRTSLVGLVFTLIKISVEAKI